VDLGPIAQMTVDYREDFLQKITNINFGSQWIGVLVEAFRLQGVTISVQVDFPDQAGGTPGIPLLTNDRANPSFFSGPHKVTAADMSRQFKTNAGAAVTGFGVRDLVPNELTSEVLLKLDKFFPKSPFTVRVTLTVNGIGSTNTISVYTIARGTIKPGLVFNSALTIPSFSIQRKGFPVTRVYDFKIDPHTLLVAPPVQR